MTKWIVSLAAVLAFAGEAGADIARPRPRNENVINGIHAITRAEITAVYRTGGGATRCPRGTRCGGPRGSLATVEITIPLNGCLDQLVAPHYSYLYVLERNVAEINLVAWNGINPRSSTARCVRTPEEKIYLNFGGMRPDTTFKLNVLKPKEDVITAVGPRNRLVPVNDSIEVVEVKRLKNKTRITLNVGEEGCGAGRISPLSYRAKAETFDGKKFLLLSVSAMKVAPGYGEVTCLALPGPAIRTIEVNGSYSRDQISLDTLDTPVETSPSR